jgi:hypothetical protein
MNFVNHATLSALVLGGAAWASNIWPGISTLPTRMLSRLIWWAVPFVLIAMINGAPFTHAVWLGSAAWVGSWVPHVEMPDTEVYWPTMLTDVFIVLLRVAILLAGPAAVFWLCGAAWFSMVSATACSALCVLGGNAISGSLRGIRTKREITGVLFGAQVGVWLTVAILLPTPMPDGLQ